VSGGGARYGRVCAGGGPTGLSCEGPIELGCDSAGLVAPGGGGPTGLSGVGPAGLSGVVPVGLSGVAPVAPAEGAAAKGVAGAPSAGLAGSGIGWAVAGPFGIAPGAIGCAEAAGAAATTSAKLAMMMREGRIGSSSQPCCFTFNAASAASFRFHVLARTWGDATGVAAAALRAIARSA
jgi:hypothetical protein